MNSSWPALAAVILVTTMMGGCSRRRADTTKRTGRRDGGGSSATRGADPLKGPPRRGPLPALEADQVYLYVDQAGASAPPRMVTEAEARASGALIVDLSDRWAPFIFQDGGGAGPHPDPAKPNGYRQTFVDLANDQVSADGRPLDAAAGDHNFLEPFGIPPTLGVLRARLEQEVAPERQTCQAQVDLAGLRAFTGNVAYLDRQQARREHLEAAGDTAWLDGEIAGHEAAATAPWRAGDRAAAIAALSGDANPRVRARVERALRGEARERAVRAVQARLSCEGHLSTRSRFTPGMFDLPTHEALAEWERKNDIFGWASVGGETQTALLRPVLELHFETFRRILAERVADAAGIVEDGSTSKWKTPPTYTTTGATGHEPPVSHPVPNLIEEHVAALLRSLHLVTPTDLLDFLRQHDAAGWATLRVAIIPPPLPPYYGPGMELSVEIDRGDVWYDFPFDSRGRPVEQHRDNFPHLTLFVHWAGQKIPLCWWRTTIGSWRSELHANGKIYYKYKNSDVGPRFWRNIVAGPVWIPPDATPARDLLTRKVLDRNKGPELVVNTEIMGPGFQSAYGLVMAIHINQSGFDNQIRTHGSVDYTSIARRFSHGCHRLVNNRAVRMFDFILRRQRFRRIGSVPLSIKRTLVVDNNPYAFELNTRGYYYDLARPIPVLVLEGRVMGPTKAPITAYVRKSGVDYRDVDAPRREPPGEPSLELPGDPPAEVPENAAGEPPGDETPDNAAPAIGP